MNQGSRKAKLRPSQDVLQRLRWDSRFDAGAYLVVYRERGGGAKELPVLSFLESQRIPWSRVIAVRHRDQTLIWDRVRRIDRLFGSGETSPDELLIPGSDGGEGFGIALDPWSWREGAWVPGGSEVPPAAPRPLRVLTWNLLFDSFSPERVQSARRLPSQLKLLRDADADLIAIQEVTPTFYAALLKEPWVREGYWLSEGPAAATLDPNGQAILSRVPLETVRIHAFSSRKQVVVASLQTSEGRLVVANLHLTSSQAERAEEVRLEQLRLLSRALQRTHPDDDWLVLGDFNQREDEPDGGLGRVGARDIWSEAGQGPGQTYDPSANGLADFFTGSGRSARFDRAYLRARSDRWRAAQAELYATAQIPNCDPPLWPSDHFALRFELSPSNGLAGEPVRSTALALVPPAALWGPLQGLRQLHDDRITRWPPHLNLLFGFVPSERFPTAIAELGPVARALPRPELELSEVNRFVLRREVVFYAAPAPAQSLVSLQAEIARVFPGCPEERPFTPHLTLGRLSRSAGEKEVLASWSEALGSQPWTPDALMFLAREGRGPYTVRASLPLGAPRGLQESLVDTGLVLSGEEVAAREAACLGLVRACVAAGALRAEAVGSAALGVALRSSDLDLWAELPEELSPADSEGQAWLSALATSLTGNLPGDPSLRVLSSELVPAGDRIQLRLYVDVSGDPPLRIDLQAGGGSTPALAEAETVLEEVSGDLPGFRLGLRALRAWARLRQFDAQAFGAFGGVGWAALAAAVWEGLATTNTPTSADLVVGVLERLAAGGQDLGKGSAQGASASPTIFARSDPSHDLAASLRPSVWRALRHEARQALPLAEAARAGTGTWSGLFLPCVPPEPPRILLSLEIAPSQAGPAQGWVASLAHELLRKLEAGGAQPRAFPTPWEEDLGEGRIELTWAVSLRGALAAGAWDRIADWLERARRHAPEGARVSFEVES